MFMDQTATFHIVASTKASNGLTENDGRGNDGPNYQFAGHENAGHENDAPKMTAGREVAGEKNKVLTEITLQRSVQMFKPNTL